MAAEGNIACRCESEERRAAEAEAHDDSQRRGLQPTLAQISALATEAQELPVDPQLKTRLEDLVAAGEDWEARASGVLHPKKVHLGLCDLPPCKDSCISGEQASLRCWREFRGPHSDGCASQARFPQAS